MPSSDPLVKLQVQDQFGNWSNLGEIANNPVSIKQGLHRALQTAMGKKSQRARVVDRSGRVIDMI